MIRILRRLVPTLLLAASGYSAASAGEVKIESGDYAQLSAKQQGELLKTMKDRGLLAGNDKVVNSAPAAEEMALGGAILMTLGPAVCKLIAGTKKQDDLAQCAKSSTPAAQDGCKAKVEAQFATVDTVCGLIKLF